MEAAQAKLKRFNEEQVREFMKKQLEEQAKQQEFIQELLRELSAEKQDYVADQLKSEMPMARWLAIQVIGNKRYHRESELTDLLMDPMPLVRMTAKQALVRLSRGNDFGPANANASAAQWTAARAAWREWMRTQDPPVQGSTTMATTAP